MEENEEVLFASRSLGGPLTFFHCLSFLADYDFLYSMGHVRGNFDLKTMTARVGSGPSVTAPKQRQGVARRDAS